MNTIPQLYQFGLQNLKACHPELGENCLMPAELAAGQRMALVNLKACHPELGENCLTDAQLSGGQFLNL